MPVLSIVTVVRNDLARLTRTLEASDCLPDALSLEWLVCDGGSTDGSYEFAQRFAEGRSRFRTIQIVDHGIYDAMNIAMHECRGQWIQYINAGDRLSDDASVLEEVLNALASTDARWAVANVLNLNGGVGMPRVVPMAPFHRRALLFRRQPYCHQGLFVRRDLLDGLGGFDESFGMAADLDLISKLASLEQPKELGRVVAIYEGGGASLAEHAKMPSIYHRLRVERYDLPLPLRALSAGVAKLQLYRNR